MENVKSVHLIVDDYGNYAIVFERNDGELVSGAVAIDPGAVDDHVETMRHEYPDAEIHVEPRSGEPVRELEDPSEPYPTPPPRRAV